MITIYVDMDGVLSGMDEQYARLFGGPPANEDEMWKNINEYQKKGEWFYDLPPKPDGIRMWESLKYLQHAFPKSIKVEVLTATGNDREKAANEKIRWCRDNLIDFKDEDFNWVQSSHNKAEYADEDSVLIDDREKSINPFNAAGGYGILHTSGNSSLIKLMDYFEERRI